MNTTIPSAELVIRPASVNDIKFIQQIAATTWQPTYTPILSKAQIDYMLAKFYSTSSLEDQMKNCHHFFLALLNHEPIGYSSFSHEGGATYKLQKLYVLPSIQKTGAGKKMLETIITIVKSMGGDVLLLNVNRNNPAKSFYKKLGFTVIKEDDIDIGNGYFMNDYVMKLQLSQVHGDVI